MNPLRAKAWSPYVAGAVIGLLQIPAFILIGTALGASSSYVTVSATIAGWFDPGISGMAQLAVGSTIAAAAMFAGGIATAFLLRRVR